MRTQSPHRKTLKYEVGMQNFNRSSAVILGLALVLGLASLGYLLGNAALAVKGMERTVVVKGLSEREVPADVAIWPVSFQVAGNDLDTVYKTVESNVATIRAFLINHGITAEEISLTPPQVTDLLAQQWGNPAQARFRYTGSAAVSVYSQNVAAVRAAIADVVELGKQGVAVGGGNYAGSGGQYLFTGLSELKPSMIEEATKNARSVAEKFAADSNSVLGKIKSARQGQFTIGDRDATTPYIKKVRVVSTVEYYLSD